jgi:hypothetical protein
VTVLHFFQNICRLSSIFPGWGHASGAACRIYRLAFYLPDLARFLHRGLPPLIILKIIKIKEDNCKVKQILSLVIFENDFRI